MSSIPQVCEELEVVLTQYPKQIEREVGFVQRSTALLDGPTFVQLCVLTWMAHPNAGYSDLQRTAATLGVEVSAQAIEQRFSAASRQVLEQVWQEAVGRVVCSEPMQVELLSRFGAVSLQDGTIISLPDSLHEQWAAGGGKGQKAAIRVQARMEMLTGQMAGMWVQASHEHEQSGEPMQMWPADSLLVADSAYFTQPQMREHTQEGRFFLTHAKASSCVRDAKGHWHDLVSYLRESADGVVDEQVLLGKREQVPVRLIAVRLGEAHVQQRQQRAGKGITHPPKGCQTRRVGERKPKEQRQGKRKREKVSAARVRLAEWVLLLTNVPQEKVSAAEAVVLLRMRWQIELYWKLCKQHGKLDTWASSKPERIVSEVFAKLIGLLITHWQTLVGCWSEPNHSMVKAKHTVEWMTPCLALAFSGAVAVQMVVQRTARVMKSGAKVNSRRRHPTTAQWLLDPNLNSS